MLLPNIENIPFFVGNNAAENRKDEYLHYRCGSVFFTVSQGRDIPDICKKYHYSIGYYAYGGAFCEYWFFIFQIYITIWATLMDFQKKIICFKYKINWTLSKYFMNVNFLL